MKTSLFRLGMLLAAGLGAFSLAPAAEAKSNIYFQFGSPHHARGCDWLEHASHCTGPHFRHRHRQAHFDNWYFDEPFFDDSFVHRPQAYNRLDCDEAGSLVRERGFHRVRATDCRGKSYSFKAVKKGRHYVVKVNAFTGHMKAIKL